MYAVADVMANHDSSTSKKKTSSLWGKYFRVNNYCFSGNGDEFHYYEVDFGCEGNSTYSTSSSSYYNNGSAISRGTCRFVFTKQTDSCYATSIDSRHLFYTCHNYSGFQDKTWFAQVTW